MKVYILSRMDEEGGEDIRGVYYSVVGAKGHNDVKDSTWIDHRQQATTCVEYTKNLKGITYFIYEYEVQ